jgi:hypothetical protein
MADSDIEDVRKQQLLHLVDNFRERIREGTSNPGNFITITEIERFWSDLRSDTDALYTDMLSELMEEIDESEILRKKKSNTGKKA